MAQVFWFTDHPMMYNDRELIGTHDECGLKFRVKQPKWPSADWVEDRSPVITVEAFDFKHADIYRHEHTLTMRQARELAVWLTKRVIANRVRNLLRRPPNF
jgi:hypothetical protein